MTINKFHKKKLLHLLQLLEEETFEMVLPASFSIVEKFGKDPFLILISCLLSLRTKDTIMLPASLRLFSHARTPQEILSLPTKEIEKLIYPVAFYRRRALHLKQVSLTLIENFNGAVPKTKDALLSIFGVGLKTTNLVLSMAFDIPALCVDTHVHRISNRFQIVMTKTPEETEKALQNIIPKEYWIRYCNLLVTWGQNVCKARGQKCHLYSLSSFCNCSKSK